MQKLFKMISNYIREHIRKYKQRRLMNKIAKSCEDIEITHIDIDHAWVVGNTRDLEDDL